MECAKTFLGLCAFVPESFGIHLSHSVPAIHAFQPGSGSHAQCHGYTFFGVVSVLLVVLAVKLMIPKTRFWLVFLMLTSICLLEIPPFSAVIDLLTFPVIHHIIPKLMIPVAFCVVAGHAAVYLENNWDRCSAKVLWTLIGTICAVIDVAVARHDFLLGQWSGDERQAALHMPVLRQVQSFLPVGIALLLAVGYALVQGKRWTAWMLLAASLVALAVPDAIQRKHPEVFDNVLIRSGTAFLIIAAAAGVLFGLAWEVHQRGWLGRTGMVLICLLLTLGTAGASLYPSLACTGAPLSDRQMALLLAMGLGKFVVLGLGLVYLLATLSHRPELRAVFCPCLCTLLLIDLIPFDKNYSRQITEAFARPDQLYPDRSDLVAQGAREGIDTPTYRVNHPHVALRLSAGEMDTNLPCVYGVRMYGGLNSDVPKGLVSLMRKFEPSVRASSSRISSQLTHPKLLDLLGCAYDADESGRLVRRSSALSRFMLFHRFEVVDSRRVLDRLAEDSFVAGEQLIVESDPGLGASEDGAPAEVVSYDSLGTSELRVACSTPTPALLFFGDSYHPDWRVYVDGRRQLVLRADGNFMSVAIPAGNSEVRSRFRPHMYARGLAISGVGAAGFLGLLVWTSRRRRRRRAQPILPLDRADESELRAA